MLTGPSRFAPTMPISNTSIVLVKRSRTRKGCTTCKIRKVKCGEEKPSCLRCTSTGRKCDGYPLSPTENALDKSRIVKHESLSPQVISTHQNLGDNIEYLEFYHHCAAPNISSRFDKNFWSRVPLRMAQSELSVRHALIALSYLNKTETGTLKNARASLVTVSEQKTMLHHYNKAVKHLVQRMLEPSFSAELGLVCCLLFICLEFLRGNYDTGMAHYKSGLKIISAYKDKHPPGTIRSLRSDMVEETLIPMFMRNMATAIIFGLPTEQVAFSSHYPSGTQECVFKTVVDADLSGHNIRNMAFILARILGTKVVTGEPHSPDDLQLQQDCLEHHRVWMRALDQLERRTTLSEEDAIAANMLRALHWTNYIFAARILINAQSDFDQHLDDFKAVLGYTRMVLDSRTARHQTAANFTFDIGFIPSLYLTACRCRCPFTRREALSLLERDLPREGLWDAQQHAVVARRVIEYEEMEVDPFTGWPVERQRIWSTMIRGEMGGNGRFPVDFVIGHWGEGRGTPPLPPGGMLPHDPNGRIWREWFVL